MQNISLSDVRAMQVPLPPIAEQKRIVAEIERRFSAIDEAESAAYANLLRANRLRQGILKQAFEGELVPQDPSDEPASVLLERVSNERAASHATARQPRRTSTRAKASNPALRAPLPI
jgi:type I restriction enzyme S subunit